MEWGRYLGPTVRNLVWDLGWKLGLESAGVKCVQQPGKENWGDCAEEWKVAYQGGRPGLRAQEAWDMELEWWDRGRLTGEVGGGERDDGVVLPRSHATEGEPRML